MKSFSIKFLILYFSLSVIYINQTKSQTIPDQSWSSIDGIYGGRVYDLVIDPIDPNIVYVVTMNGIFKTIDGGENWYESNNGLPQKSEYSPIDDIVIDLNNPNILYCGPYKTIDGGENWILHNTRDISAIDPQNSKVLYSVGDGLYKSTNEGNSWIKIYPDYGQIFISPSDSNVLVMLTNSKIEKSIDGGTIWTDITNNLSAYEGFISLTFHPEISDIIYLTTNDGVRKTVNGGAVWFTAGGMHSGTIIVVDENSPNTLYLAAEFGVKKTTDGGASWNNTTNSTGAHFIALSKNSSVLFGGIGGIYGGIAGTIVKSINGGSSWETKQKGIIGYESNQIHFPSTNSNTIIFGTHGAGLFISKDNGSTWTQNPCLDGVIGVCGSISSICTDFSNDEIIYVADKEGKIHKTSNGGIT